MPSVSYNAGMTFLAMLGDAFGLVIAIKLQIAYLSVHRAEGQFEKMLAYKRRVAPYAPLILNTFASTFFLVLAKRDVHKTRDLLQERWRKFLGFDLFRLSNATQMV